MPNIVLGMVAPCFRGLCRPCAGIHARFKRPTFVISFFSRYRALAHSPLNPAGGFCMVVVGGGLGWFHGYLLSTLGILRETLWPVNRYLVVLPSIGKFNLAPPLLAGFIGAAGQPPDYPKFSKRDPSNPRQTPLKPFQTSSDHRMRPQNFPKNRKKGACCCRCRQDSATKPPCVHDFVEKSA